MALDVNLLKQLREETQASVADIRKALEESENDLGKARELLRKRGAEIAEKKAERETSQGLVEAYVHSGKIGVLVKLSCETDFVARTEEFKALAHEIAMQISAMDPKDTEALLAQEYIRDPKLTIADLVKEAVGKVGENIKVAQFSRIEL